MTGGSIRLRLRVSPGAGRPGVVGRHGSAWKLRVAAAAERGAANEELIGLVARTLSLSRRQVALVAGHSTRDKLVEVSGIEPEDAERLLAEAGRKERRA